MKRCPVGRADLVDLLRTLDAASVAGVADLLGFEAGRPSPAQARSDSDVPPRSGPRADSEFQAAHPTLPPLDVPFLCPLELVVLEPWETRPVPPGRELSTSAAVCWRGQPKEPPEPPRLAVWPELLPRLGRGLGRG